MINHSLNQVIISGAAEEIIKIKALEETMEEIGKASLQEEAGVVMVEIMETTR